MNQKNLSTRLYFLVAGLLFVGCSKATLKPEPPNNVVQVVKAEVTDSRGNKMMDKLAPNEKYNLSLELVNRGRQTIPAGIVKISSRRREVHIEKDQVNFESIAPQGRAAITSPLIFSVSRPFSLAQVDLSVKAGPSIVIPLNLGNSLVPQSLQDSVEVVDFIVDDSVGGNGDGRINPGEQVKVRLRLKNTSGHSIDSSRAVVTALQPGITILDSLLFIPRMSSGETVTSLDDFTMIVDPNYPGPNIPLRVKAIKGANYDTVAYPRVYRELMICIEDFRIVLGEWNADCRGRGSDLLKIRLAICNERSSSFSNATAQILANSIYLCGRDENLCTVDNTNDHNDKVYFGQLTAYECAHAKSPCTYKDNNKKDHEVAFMEEFIYTIDLKDPATHNDLVGKYCFSFAVQLFKNVYKDDEDCQFIDDGQYERKYLSYSYTIPPIPPCPYIKELRK